MERWWEIYTTYYFTTFQLSSCTDIQKRAVFRTLALKSELNNLTKNGDLSGVETSRLYGSSIPFTTDSRIKLFIYFNFIRQMAVVMWKYSVVLFTFAFTFAVHADAYRLFCWFDSIQ